MTPAGERFWNFSVALYARPGIEEALLALQAEDGLDVTLVLFCLHAARRGESLGGARLDAMRRIGTVWGEDVVASLRAARRALKPLALPGSPADGLREDVKRLELTAEQAMHAELEALLPEATGASGGRPLAERNLAAWLGTRKLIAADRLAAVLDAGFAA